VIRCKRLIEHLDGHAKGPPKIIHTLNGTVVLPDGTLVTDEDKICQLKDQLNVHVQHEWQTKEVILVTISKTVYKQLVINQKLLEAPTTAIWKATHERYGQETQHRGTELPNSRCVAAALLAPNVHLCTSHNGTGGLPGGRGSLKKQDGGKEE
jgi:hypothetical protein